MCAIASVLLAGCTQGSGDALECPATDRAGTVSAVEGQSLRVEATKGDHAGPVVLHIRDETDLLRKEPDGCRPITVGEVPTGANVDFRASGPWMESYPPQTTPSVVIVT
jgi:hypothetical protein